VEFPVSDDTPSLQRAIREACSSLGSDDPDRFATIKLPKGDYLVQALEIPKNCRILFFSTGRVRLLFSGKRNRPLFVLGENSALVLREKLEIYYNTNNIQEVARLMIRSPPTGRVEISKDVKVSLFSYKTQSP
jgi:hypothetical protein